MRRDVGPTSRLAGLIAIAVSLVITPGAFSGDKFGDSTATNSRICSQSTLILGKYLSGGTSGILDSMRIWSRYNDGGNDTVIACIYSVAGSLIGRSTDSVIVANDVLNPYMLHFNNQSINIAATTRYWIGVQLRASGASTNSRFGTASPNDSLYLGNDPLPLESGIPGANRYLGSSVEAIRITGYYSTHGNNPSQTKRRRTGFHGD